jgi:hypothetical protein
MKSPRPRWLQVVGLALGVSFAGIAAGLLLTWPDNALGDYLRIWRNWRDRIAGLEHRVATENDPLVRAYYQAWLTEERGDVRQAIAGYRSVREAATPGSRLHLHAALRLGRAHGSRGEHAEELAAYESLMASHPGPSGVSQALFFLRRGDRARARAVLDQALARDARDDSLGEDRALARSLRNSLHVADQPGGARSGGDDPPGSSGGIRDPR